MILSETIPVKIGAHPDYYREKGYEIPMKEASPSVKRSFHKEMVIDKQKTVNVKIEDLPTTCKLKVYVECDCCHEKRWLEYGNYIQSIENGGYYSCVKCRESKRKETNLRKYGVESPSQMRDFKEKIKIAWQNKTPEELKEIRQKQIKTNNERYGVDYTLQSPEIMERIENTLFQKYGIRKIYESSEFRIKAAQTLSKNGNQKCSSQQKEIFNIYNKYYNCELNYPIKWFSGDIVFLDFMIDLEIDFSGHDLCVKRGTMTQEEFDKREMMRNITTKKLGYNTIRILSKKDWIPNEDKLIEIFNISLDYFNKTNHTWITFDIDKSIYINYDNRDGVIFDFGQLHKVKYKQVV